MHDPTFMALALKKCPKHKKFTPPPLMPTTPEKQYICLASASQARQYMTILTFVWLLWPWPSIYLKSCFKWHFSSSRATTVQNYFEIHAQMYKLCSGQAKYMYMTILTLNWPLWPWPFTYLKNVSIGTSPPKGQQLCHIVLKSMHHCTIYGPDKSGRTHWRTDACTYTELKL